MNAKGRFFELLFCVLLFFLMQYQASSKLVSNLSSVVYSKLVSKAAIFGIYYAICNMFCYIFCALLMQLLLIKWCKDVSRFCDAKARNLVSNDGMLSKLVFFSNAPKCTSYSKLFHILAPNFKGKTYLSFKVSLVPFLCC